MSFTQSTDDVQSQITERARQLYHGHLDSMQQYIAKEMAAFATFQTHDLSQFPEIRLTILKYAFAMGESWSERMGYLVEAREKYSEFLSVEDERFSPMELSALKEEIVENIRQSSSAIPSCAWMDNLKRQCEELYQRKRYEKYSHLIPEMEKIVGNYFYNESNGDFRYPITFYDGEGKKVTRRSRIDDIPSEIAFCGHYQVGANALMIVRALADVIERLEEKFDLDMARKVDSE